MRSMRSTNKVTSGSLCPCDRDQLPGPSTDVIHRSPPGHFTEMPTTKTFLMSNLAAALFLDLEVDEQQDLAVAARDRLRDMDLPLEIQQGFFVSLYPHRTDVDGPDGLRNPDQFEDGGPAESQETQELIRD